MAYFLTKMAFKIPNIPLHIAVVRGSKGQVTLLKDDERNTAPTKILKHNFISYRFQSHRLSSVK